MSIMIAMIADGVYKVSYKRESPYSWYNEEVKTCTKCKLVKPESDYHWDSTNNKYTYQCKNCRHASRYARRKTPGTSAWWSRRYEKRKASALKRGIAYNLTRNEMMDLYNQEKCFYCESIPAVKSIDRRDNSGPYQLNNCVMACFDCNVLKSALTLDQIKMFATKLGLV